MTVAKSISVIKSSDLLDQKPPTISRLSKKELAELHAAPTNYRRPNHHVTDLQSISDAASRKLSQKSTNGTTDDPLARIFHTDSSRGAAQSASGSRKPQQNWDEISGLDGIREKPQESKLENGEGNLASKGKSVLKNSNSLITHDGIKAQKEEDVLHFYEENSENDDGDVNFNKDEIDQNSDSLPSARSLAGEVTRLISQIKSLFPIDSPSLDEDQSFASITVATNQLSKQSRITSSLNHELSSLSNIKNVDSFNVDTDDHDVSGDGSFERTLQERVHEATNKMGEKESEGNSAAIKPLMAHAEFAPVTGSASFSNTTLSEPVAAALRVTHLLDELTATVSRLRLESNDGKALTIQLRREVLADTNIHIVSSAKQMEVSFLTSNAASNFLLNTHLTTLQNHLNFLCPGQVVNVQTQLTPSSGSSHLRSEQDHSRDDLASFDEGNRRNFSNDEDSL